ncbi:MAG: hypothetical protein JST12_19670 [Armatimonadetes bacterium]|nr:hypothetical protein [Armatimonadota bacterium]
MIVPLVCLAAFSEPKLKVGQKWDYVLTWHYKSADLDSTDEESFLVEVTRVEDESYQIQVTQKLLATLFDDQRIPTDPSAVPAKHNWTLFPNGAIAFMPEARFPLEYRFYRVLKGVLPEPKGEVSRDREWTVNFADDGRGTPAAALAASPEKHTKEGDWFYASYREANGTNGLGHFLRTEKSWPFPSFLEVNFTHTMMPGGTETVDCDFTMKLKPEKE